MSNITNLLFYLFIFVMIVTSCRADSKDADYRMTSKHKKSSRSTLKNVDKFHELNNMRLFLIGDSVDRYAVSDWCHHYDGILVTDKTMNDPEYESSSAIMALKYEMSRYRDRQKSWEFRLCLCSQRNVNISFVFNRIGVHKSGPYFMPITTTYGIKKQLQKSKSLLHSLKLSIGPAIRILSKSEIIGGNSLDGVIVNSGFWDLVSLKCSCSVLVVML